MSIQNPTSFRSHANRNALIRATMAVIPPRDQPMMAPIVSRICDTHMRGDYSQLTTQHTLMDVNKVCLSRISTDLKRHIHAQSQSQSQSQSQLQPKKTLVILDDELSPLDNLNLNSENDSASTSSAFTPYYSPPQSLSAPTPGSTNEKLTNEEINERIAMEIKTRRLEFPQPPQPSDNETDSRESAEVTQSRVTWASPIQDDGIPPPDNRILQLESRITALEEQVRELITNK